jgi:hypothetical protein
MLSLPGHLSPLSTRGGSGRSNRAHAQAGGIVVSDGEEFTRCSYSAGSLRGEAQPYERVAGFAGTSQSVGETPPLARGAGLGDGWALYRPSGA